MLSGVCVRIRSVCYQDCLHMCVLESEVCVRIRSVCYQGCVPLARGVEARAAQAIPGTVGVSGQTAVSTCLPVGMATVQGHLGDPMLGADVKLLL